MKYQTIYDDNFYMTYDGLKNIDLYRCYSIDRKCPYVIRIYRGTKTQTLLFTRKFEYVKISSDLSVIKVYTFYDEKYTVDLFYLEGEKYIWKRRKWR